MKWYIKLIRSNSSDTETYEGFGNSKEEMITKTNEQFPNSHIIDLWINNVVYFDFKNKKRIA